MKEPRPLAMVRDYVDLHAALRARVLELRFTHDGLNEATGLPAGYVNKLLAPVPIRKLGANSLGPMLTALGLVLILAEDVETIARLERMEKRIRPPRAIPPADANETMPTKRRKQRRGFRTSEAGRIMRARGLLLLTEPERKRISQIAARARWAKRQSGDSPSRL